MPKKNYLTKKRTPNVYPDYGGIDAEDQDEFQRSDASEEEDGDVMTVEEAARFLKTSRPSLLKGVQNGDVPCLRIGTLYRFSREALAEAMKEKKIC